MLAALCFQASLLANPLYLEPEPPELRTARNILVLYDAGAESSREEAVTLAEALVERIRGGEPFEQVAAQHSRAWNARSGAVLGTFPYGVLEAPLDPFLFTAAVGEISEPLVNDEGVHVLQRVDTLAGVRQILLAGDGANERAQVLLERLGEGADFAELAREHSDDEASAARGGALGIFERGSRDRMVKAAAFAARVGEVVGPIETPLGLHLVQRVEPDTLDPALRETTLVRAQGILVSWSGAVAAPRELQRPRPEAERIALAIHADLVAEKPFEEAARDFNDDPSGKQRAGDLGWIHRANPDLPRFMDQLFLVEPGTLLEPISTAAGYVILRRTR